MSQVSVEEIRSFLRVIHTSDDALLQILIDGAEVEACRFLNRTQLPTLPFEYPIDSNGDPTDEEVPDSSDEIAPDVRIAIYYLVQTKYEGTKPEDITKMRSAAETLLMPYRVAMGV